VRRTILWSLALLLAALLVVRVGVRSKAVAPGSRGDIAFASNRTGNDDIYALTPSSGAVSPLIQTSANERAPAWNPDGTKLAFARDTPNASCASPCWQLYVWDSVAHTTTKLSSFGTTSQVFDPAWSNDGTDIAFTKMDTVVSLQAYVVPADGSSAPRRVTAGDTPYSSPDWSPDDATLVMSSKGSLYTIASTASVGTPTAVSLSGPNVPAYVKEPTWGPDGRLAFTGGPSKFSMYELYVADSDGTGTDLLWSNGSGTISGPAWAPDASRIAFALVPSGTDSDIGFLNLCKGTVTYPAPDPSIDLDPNWQPVQPAPASIPPCDSPSPSPSATPSATSTTSSSTATSSSTTTTATTTSSTSSPPPSPPDGTHVQIGDAGFDPVKVRISRGGTAIWDNAGTIERGSSDVSAMTLWDTGLLPVGWSGWSTFTAAGRYRYADPADVSHTGAVVVRVGAAPHEGLRASSFTITWASQAADAGFAYDVQIRRPGGRWRAWKHRVTRASASFTPDAGRGTYRFRARLVEVGVDDTGWSPVSSIEVR
jgi:plastocyanin